jgi:hypothetical protein
VVLKEPGVDGDEPAKARAASGRKKTKAAIFRIMDSE